MNYREEGASVGPLAAHRFPLNRGLLSLLLLASVAAMQMIGCSNEDSQVQEEAAAIPVAPDSAVVLVELVIDAKPWAIVQRVYDGANEIELPELRETPLNLLVKPGLYKVELERDSDLGSEERLTCILEVEAGQPALCEIQVEELSVADYFENTGWWE